MSENDFYDFYLNINNEKKARKVNKSDQLVKSNELILDVARRWIIKTSEIKPLEDRYMVYKSGPFSSIKKNKEEVK